jgi:hypothetical protein
MANFAGLTFAVQPVVTGAGVLNTAGIVGGTTVIAGILDPTSTQRIFNPQAEGNAVVTGDAYTKWLPVVTTGGLTATTINDQYWQPVFQGGTTQVPQPNNKIGQVQLQLTPAAANVVEASSVMRFYLSPQALVITCTAGTF